MSDINAGDTQNNADILDQYKDQIYIELGLDKYSSEEREKISAKIDDLISDRLINLVLTYLPEDKVAETDKMMSGTAEEGIKYLSQNIPGFADKVANELIAIRNELIESMKKENE